MPGGWLIGWGEPVLTKVITVAAGRHPHRTPGKACWHLGRPGEWRRLRRRAHMLGFGGHFCTKARRYSITFALLHNQRVVFRRTQPAGPELDAAAQGEPTRLVVNLLQFVGAGWQTPADAMLANTSAAMARDHQQAAHEYLSTVAAGTAFDRQAELESQSAEEGEAHSGQAADRRGGGSDAGTTERFPRRLIARAAHRLRQAGRARPYPGKRPGGLHRGVDRRAAVTAVARRQGGGLMAAKRRFGRVGKLPSGRYQARYQGPDGLDHPAPQTFPTKREADRFLALVEADIATGKWYAPSAGRTTARPPGDAPPIGLVGVAECAEQWFAAAASG